MLETKDLILDKAKFSDWEDIYRRVWSRPECARYMFWRVTESEDEARERMERTIAFQKERDAYFIYEKADGCAIGFAGVEQIWPGICRETGICIGPDYWGRGYGRQVLRALLQHCREKYSAREFQYSAREKNEASVALALSEGFTLAEKKTVTDEKDGREYTLLKYTLEL
ncbi:MAG: GNAT family N-acetyltransferase [Oscillospiraceae bacterium]|nr:GNAT family N-acetyltransferase [Oscillospiraceae bacterium]